MISSKFLKSFRGGRDLVVFYNYFSDFSGVSSDFRKQAPPSHKDPKTFKAKTLRKLT